MSTDELLQLGPRERLLSTASRLFYEQGYHATGINQIIREAQIAKATFYDHFGSKEDLAVAYLEQRRQRWIALLTAATPIQPSPHERVLDLFRFLEWWVTDTGFRGCAFLNIASEFPSTDNQIRATVAAHKQTQWHFIYELVQAASPTFDDAALRARTHTIYLLFESALVESRTFRSLWPVQAATEAARQALS